MKYRLIFVLMVSWLLIKGQHVIHSIHPFWSPDGRHILYHTMGDESGIYIYDLQSSKPLKVRAPEGAGLANWSYDSNKIFVWNKEGKINHIYSLKLPDKLKGRINRNEIRGDGFAGGWVLSENKVNRKIAYTSEIVGNPDIYVLDPKTRKSEPLVQTELEESEGQWSPDGKWLAYLLKENENFEIALADAKGNQHKKVTNYEGMDAAPAWFPSSDRIAFQSDRSGDVEVYSIRTDGSDLVRLTHTQGFDGEPSVSPDGKQIAFVSQRAGPFEIFIINSDGTEPRRLTFGG